MENKVRIANKAMSGQYFAMICFSLTTCIGFLMKLIPPEVFVGLAATVITGYQLRKKEVENEPTKS